MCGQESRTSRCAHRSRQDLIVAQKRAVSLVSCSDVSRFGPGSSCEPQIRKPAMALHALIALDIHHGDFASRNLLISSFDPLDPSCARAVIFDFGTSAVRHAEYRQDFELHESCASLFRMVEHTGFVRGCWRANLRDTPEEAVEGGWLAFWRKWDDVEPGTSDYDEKRRTYDVLMRLHERVLYFELYGPFVLPEWAEGLVRRRSLPQLSGPSADSRVQDWSDLTVAPDPESDSTASQ